MSADAIRELLERHARLMDEKDRLRKSGQTPPTTINYELTQVVSEVVQLAKEDKNEGVRLMLAEKAGAGHLGAEDALEWLSEGDTWWRGRDE